jgi:AcrR family transcriptional regulator
MFREVCDGEMRVMQDASALDAASSVQRLERVIGTFARRALGNPRLAWALIAEPVDPLVDAERLAFRAAYAQLFAATLREAIAAGELPEQNVDLSAAAIVGGVGEVLVGPLSPLASEPPSIDEIVAEITHFARRAVGAP